MTGWYRVLGVLLLLAACTAQSPAPPTSSGSSATVAHPTQPRAPSPPVQPTPSATPVPRGLPPVPVERALPQSPAFARLHGATQDLAALQRAAQALLGDRGGRLWLGAFPQDFPQELPLPDSGWLLAALYRPGPTEQWTLYIEAAETPASWRTRFQERLARQGWYRQGGGEVVPPLEAPGLSGLSWMEDWCPREGIPWSLTLVFDMRLNEHTLAVLHYQRNSAFLDYTVCADEGRAIREAEAPLPTFTAPPGMNLVLGEPRTGAGIRFLAFRLLGSAPLEAVADALRGQLQAQGWSPKQQEQGRLFAGEGLHLVAESHREDREPLRLDLFLWRSREGYNGWLFILPREAQDASWQGPNTLRIEAEVGEPALWQRFLAWYLGDVVPGRQTDVWVARAAERLPERLPFPQEARWVVTTYTIEPPGVPRGPVWTFVMATDLPPATVQQGIDQDLREKGWVPLPNRDPWGVQTARALWEGLYCDAREPRSLTVELLPGAEPEATWVRFRMTQDEGPCRAQAVPEGALQGVPPLQLRLPAETTDLLPAGWLMVSAEGLDEAALVRTLEPDEALMQSIVAQMEEQGWQVVEQGRLAPQVTWFLARTQDTQGRTWQAHVLLQRREARQVLFRVWSSPMP